MKKLILLLISFMCLGGLCFADETTEEEPTYTLTITIRYDDVKLDEARAIIRNLNEEYDDCDNLKIEKRLNHGSIIIYTPDSNELKLPSDLSVSDDAKQML